MMAGDSEDSDDDAPQNAVIWTAAEQSLMKENIERFRNGTRSERKKLLIAIFVAIKALQPSDCQGNTPAWKRRKQQVKTWFLNNGRKRNPKSVFSFGRKWSDERVVGHLYKARVIDVVTQLTGARPGSRDFIKKYYVGCKQVYDGLSLEDREEVKRMGIKWSKEGPTPVLQRRAAVKKGYQFHKEVAESAYRILGTRLLTFEAHYNEAGQLGYTMHDFNPMLGSTRIQSFRDRFPDLVQSLEQAWGEYSAYAFESYENNTAHHAVNIKMRKKTLLNLEKDADGLPLLPAPRDRAEGITFQQNLIRSFVTAHYCLAAGREDAVVPWGAIAAQQESFMDCEYIPELITLNEPSRLRKADTDALLKLWRKRQSDPKIKFAFRFSHFKKSSQEEHIFLPAVYDVPGSDPKNRSRKPKKKSQRSSKKKPKEMLKRPIRKQPKKSLKAPTKLPVERTSNENSSGSDREWDSWSGIEGDLSDSERQYRYSDEEISTGKVLPTPATSVSPYSGGTPELGLRSSNRSEEAGTLPLFFPDTPPSSDGGHSVLGDLQDPPTINPDSDCEPVTPKCLPLSLAASSDRRTRSTERPELYEAIKQKASIKPRKACPEKSNKSTADGYMPSKEAVIKKMKRDEQNKAVSRSRTVKS